LEPLDGRDLAGVEAVRVDGHTRHQRAARALDKVDHRLELQAAAKDLILLVRRRSAEGLHLFKHFGELASVGAR